MKERQLIWERRRKGQEFPWTKNEILRDNKFTNIYRELDRGTIYWFRYVANSSNTASLLWKTVIYRLVNKQDTFSWMKKKYRRFPKMSEVGVESWIRRFKKAPEPKFTGAHMVFGGPGDKTEKLKDAMLTLLPVLDQYTTLVEGLDDAEHIWLRLQTMSGVGKFVAYEVLTDLITAGATRVGINDWCNPGPGCVQGQNIIFEGQTTEWTREGRIEVCKWLQKHQHQLMEKAKVRNFPFWDGEHEIASLAGNKGELSLRSIEHSLCEFQKYWRCLHGGRAKNRYVPSGRKV